MHATTSWAHLRSTHVPFHEDGAHDRAPDVPGARSRARSVRHVIACEPNAPGSWADQLRTPTAADHKYTRGHVVVSGGWPLTGAARLAARAAARAGAGIVTLAAPPRGWAVYARALESALVRPVYGRIAWRRLLEDPRVGAVVLGPGAGATRRTRTRVLDTLSLRRDLPVVLDADAINVFAGDPEGLARAVHGAGSWCVLTPHHGEFVRVFGEELGAREAAALTGAVVVRKGPHTQVATPDGACREMAHAPHWLATAGTGDVLSGIVAALLAQGVPPFDAASAAVWVQAEAARRVGRGLVASDLPDEIPAAMDAAIAVARGAIAVGGDGDGEGVYVR
ncbi:MAG: hypothetical protein RL283_229 [Actinomycetota bacterium]